MRRERALAPHRLALVVVVLALAGLALLAKHGPAWWQRVYYPLRYQAAIAASAHRFGVDPYLVASLIDAESGFRSDRVSSAGAVGLMQLLPATGAELARKLGVTGDIDAARLRDPALNIELGTRHLADLLERYHDTRTAVAAYNAGAGNVDRWLRRAGATRLGADIPFPETRRYVARVLAGQRRYRELYPDAFSF